MTYLDAVLILLTTAVILLFFFVRDLRRILEHRIQRNEDKRGKY